MAAPHKEKMPLLSTEEEEDELEIQRELDLLGSLMVPTLNETMTTWTRPYLGFESNLPLLPVKNSSNVLSTIFDASSENALDSGTRIECLDSESPDLYHESHLWKDLLKAVSSRDIELAAIENTLQSDMPFSSQDSGEIFLSDTKDSSFNNPNPKLHGSIEIMPEYLPQIPDRQSDIKSEWILPESNSTSEDCNAFEDGTKCLAIGSESLTKRPQDTPIAGFSHQRRASGVLRLGHFAPLKKLVSGTPDLTISGKSGIVGTSTAKPLFTGLNPSTKNGYELIPQKISGLESHKGQKCDLTELLDQPTLNAEAESDLYDKDLDIKFQDRLSELNNVMRGEEEILMNLQLELTKQPNSAKPFFGTAPSQGRSNKKQTLQNRNPPYDTHTDVDDIGLLIVFGTGEHVNPDSSTEPQLDHELHESPLSESGGPVVSELPFDMTEFSTIADNADPEEITEAEYLNALIRKYESELEWVQNKISEERTIQKDIRFQIESLAASKTSRLRSIRDNKEKLLLINEKYRLITQWLNVESKATYEREKDRAIYLIRRVYDFMKLLSARIPTEKLNLDKSKQCMKAAEKLSMEVRSKAAGIRSECLEAEKQIKHFRVETENLECMIGEKMALRGRVLESRIIAETVELERDFGFISKALDRRRQIDGVSMELEELDMVDLSDSGLARIPKNLKLAKRATHVDVDKNDLTMSTPLEELSDLLSLSASHNKFEKLELSQLNKLRSLTVSNNQIKELTGLNKELTYLDISSNPISNIDSLSSATLLQILILGNSRIHDLSAFKCLNWLIYIDMSDCRLTESAFEYLADSPILQYISISKNLVRSIPDLHNLLLYELDMSSNLLSHLHISTWLGCLSVLNLSNNRITDIQPLCMCPFLKILFLENNKIHDISSIYSISVCQKLQILDLSGNPIETNPLFYKTVGTIFLELKSLNKNRISRTIGDLEKKMYYYKNPLKLAGICLKCIEHMEYSVYDDSESPFLSYLTSSHTQYSKDAVVRLQLQERRLFLFSNLLTTMSREYFSIPAPTCEPAIFVWIEKLHTMIDEYHIIYVQSLWRMRRDRALFLKFLKDTQICQRAAKRWCECFKAKKTLDILREARKVDSAIMIQKHFRVEFVDAKPTDADDIPSDEDLDKWIEVANDNHFDDKMNDYLSTENLLHFSPAFVPPILETRIDKDKSASFAEVLVERVKPAPWNTPLPISRVYGVTSSRLGTQREDLLNKITTQYNALANSTHLALQPSDVARAILISTGETHIKELGKTYIPPPEDISRVQDQIAIHTPRAQVGTLNKLAHAAEMRGHHMRTAAEEQTFLPPSSIKPAYLDQYDKVKVNFPQAHERIASSSLEHEKHNKNYHVNDDSLVLLQDHQAVENHHDDRSALDHLSDRDSIKMQSHIATTQDESGWAQYGAKTQMLYEKKRRRMQKLEAKPHERKMMRDPLHRYHAFCTHTPGEREEFQLGDTPPYRSTLNPNDTSTIYEWDIHPRSTTRRSLLEPHEIAPHRPIPDPEFQVVGPGAEYIMSPPMVGAYAKAPAIKLLVNNYVAPKILDSTQIHRPIHRWIKNDMENLTSVKNMDAPSVLDKGYSSTFKHRYSTSIGTVVSKVSMPPPQFRKYELYKHPLLPAIAQSMYDHK
ncbi:hypothetical protein BASA62_000709 [Batrachochytrium salamandrivorans]|nr:hypothetical protein BASA62_000709 [Batrachochytrium salamandrivorans]